MATIRNTGSLGQAVVKFNEGAQRNIDKVVQGVTATIVTELSDRNHIWLGRMIANWNVGINQIDTFYDPNRRDKERAGTMKARNLPITAQAKAGDVVNITNATPHARHEEFGSSSREGHPVIRGVAADIPLFVSEAVTKVRSAG